MMTDIIEMFLRAAVAEHYARTREPRSIWRIESNQANEGWPRLVWLWT